MWEKGGVGDPLRVCIDARMGPAGAAGGVQQFVLGLAHGLAGLEGDGERYAFLVDWQSRQWLEPTLRGPCTVLEAAGAPRPATSGWKQAVKAVVPRTVLELPFRAAALARSLRPYRIPGSDGTVEGDGTDVLHQTVQDAFRTAVPCIYTPYDLQHVHLPEMFAHRDLRRKAIAYRHFCEAAETVVAISRHGKDDLVRSYNLAPDKVRVVHLAPAIDTSPDLDDAAAEALRRRLGLPAAFALYPAQTWPHKNHLGLLEALSRLRDREGLAVPTVFTGHQNAFFATVERRVAELGLAGQVAFTGFLGPSELKAVYRMSRLLVFPSRFEGFGMPVVEAFRLGLPVACSNATSLPEVAGDAALLFDPGDPDAAAAAIRRLWTDDVLRTDLARRGREQVRRFSWDEVARRCRALYRMVGRRALDEADRELLAAML
jgi:glycosyltransferase involved in cell wall biosynthesis